MLSMSLEEYHLVNGSAMKLEHILLGVLMQHPSTGYDLKRYLDTRGRFLRSNTQMSQVYRTLGQMEDRGWVTHRVESRPGAQDAKRYVTTEEGATIFLDWLTGSYDPPSRFQDPELTARLSFSGFLTPEQLLALIDTELATRAVEIARFRYRDRRLPAESPEGYNAHLADLVGDWSHEYGADAMDAHVAKLEKLRRQILDAPLDAPLERIVPVSASEATEV
jgi:PadR family transcriptional regulator, regulatory protein AphA